MNGATQALSPRATAAAIKDEWLRGAEPDARAALERLPELKADKSVVLDLAYEEYCLRESAGQAPDADAFCDRFPTHRRALRGIILAHNYTADNAQLLADPLPPSPRWPEPGQRLGDFVVVRELGRGGIARVYLASEESTGGRAVAVKLSAEGAAEARTQGRLAHPNIVPVLSARREESVGMAAVVMPYLGAATLLDVIDHAYPTADAPPPRQAVVVRQALRAAARPGDPPPHSAAPEAPFDGSYVDAVVRLASQVADALAFLHKEGVCHRDLKPSNVLVSPSGQALLLDFNLATDARRAVPPFGGTLPYMAPEHVNAWFHPAEEAALDERMDLFSLGVILYELLTGRHPHGRPPAGKPNAVTASAFLERQRAGCTPLRTLNPAVDRRLARLVERCLAFDRADRPTSAALADDLRRYLAAPARLYRAAARRPWAVALAVGLFLAAIGGMTHRAATREAVDAPEYRQGREAFLAGDYTKAEAAFRQALADAEADPKPRKYYLAHAEAALKLAEARGRPSDPFFGVALDDLTQAVNQQADGPTMARMGYCHARVKAHDSALVWYDRAVGAGFQSAGLFNDRGASCVQTRKVEKARKDFDAALRIDPNLQPALFNRVVLFLRDRPAVNAPPVPADILDNARRALNSEHGSQELFANAAQVFAIAAKEGGPGDGSGYAQQALLCVRKAVAFGMNAQQLERDPIISAALRLDPGFKAALAAAPESAGPENAPRLVNPAPYLPE